MKKVPLSDKVKEVIIFADYDGVGASSDVLVAEAIEYYSKERGLDVYKVIPDGKRGKEDFNDILLIDGVERLREYSNNAEKVAEGATLERLENQVKTELHGIQSATKHNAELIKVEGGRIVLTKDLSGMLQEYVTTQEIYDEAALKYFAHISDPRKAEFKKEMEQAAESARVNIDKLIAHRDYQEMIKHAKYEVPILQTQDASKFEALKGAINDGAITTGQAYKIYAQLDSSSKTLELSQSQAKKGRSK